MADIMHLIQIGASPERVYEALTTSEGVRNWWTRDADIDGEIGGVGEFRFPSYGGGYATRVAIAELVPARRVSWTTTDSFRAEWVGTSIEFDLQAEANSTTVRFTHRGFPEADDAYALCTTGWGYYLVSLRQYLQTGRGAPSPDVDFACVLRRA